jgi:hypothetical protein
MGKDVSIFAQCARQAGIAVVDLNKPNWHKRLFRAITPPFEIGPWPPADPLLSLGPAPFLSILNTVRAELEGRTAIVEPYISTDWHDEYGRLYSRILRDVPRNATRVHFFRKVGKRGVLDIEQLSRMSEATRDAYLGYTVLRPLPAFRVGDTILRSPWETGTVTEGGGIPSALVHCTEAFSASLLGNKLRVKAMPFTQQDTTVGVCAEADLWMVARYFNRQHEIGRYRPSEITNLATQNIIVGHPRHGLHEFQMLDALRQMGLNPYSLYSSNPEEVKEFIYTCIESELPVIAGIPEHVMVVIGHDYQRRMKFDKRNSRGTFVMSSCVNRFIVHDDASGPYLSMATKVRKEETVRAKKGKPVIEKEKLLVLDKSPVDFCMVCVPHRLNLLWDDVRVHAAVWLARIKSYLTGNWDMGDYRLWPDRRLKEIVTRTYLRRSDVFKMDIVDGVDPKRHPAVNACYQCLHLPRYVWVVELAARKMLGTRSPSKRLIEGEMVFDGTANRHVADESLLAFHYRGLLCIPQRGRNAPGLVYFFPPSRYRPLLRPSH